MYIHIYTHTNIMYIYIYIYMYMYEYIYYFLLYQDAAKARAQGPAADAKQASRSACGLGNCFTDYASMKHILYYFTFLLKLFHI